MDKRRVSEKELKALIEVVNIHWNLGIVLNRNGGFWNIYTNSLGGNGRIGTGHTAREAYMIVDGMRQALILWRTLDKSAKL